MWQRSGGITGVAKESKVHSLILNFDSSDPDEHENFWGEWTGITYPIVAMPGHSECPTGAKGGARPAWTIGRRKEFCDIAIDSRRRHISSIHATIFFDPSANSWYLLNGGTYPEDSNRPGEYVPSLNGIWLNGKRLESVAGADGRYIPDPAPLSPQDRIWFGAGLKMLIGSSIDDTVIPEVWRADGWNDATNQISRNISVDPDLVPALLEQVQQNKRHAPVDWRTEMIRTFRDASPTGKLFYGLLFLGAIAIAVGLPLLLAGGAW